MGSREHIEGVFLGKKWASKYIAEQNLLILLTKLTYVSYNKTNEC